MIPKILWAVRNITKILKNVQAIVGILADLTSNISIFQYTNNRMPASASQQFTNCQRYYWDDQIHIELNRHCLQPEIVFPFLFIISFTNER